MNNKIIKNQNKKPGSGIVYVTMITLIAVLTVTISAAAIVRNHLIVSRDRHNSTRAFYAAESGSERMLWEVRVNHENLRALCTDDTDQIICFNAAGDIVSCGAGCGGGQVEQVTLSNGEKFGVEYLYDSGTASTTMGSVGVYSQSGHNEVGRKSLTLY